MSIPNEIDRASTSNPRPDEAFRHEDAEAEKPGVGGDGEHGRLPAGQEEEEESGGAEEEHKAPAAAPPTSATAVNVKKTFGMRRANSTVNKGVKSIYNPFPLVSHEF